MVSASQLVVALLVKLVAEDQCLEQVPNKFASLGPKAVHLQQQADVLEHAGVLQQFWLLLFLPQFGDRLHLVH
jgi:hypothetical protein